MIEISLGEMANGLSFGRKGVRDDAWPRPSGALASVSRSGLNQYVLDALRIFSPKSEYLIERSSISRLIAEPAGSSAASAAATGAGQLSQRSRSFVPTQRPTSSSSTPGR